VFAGEKPSTNHERPHQSIGRMPPIERFKLAVPRSDPVETAERELGDIETPVTTRRVSVKGTTSFAAAQYKAGA
jgi:hypothetical protein